MANETIQLLLVEDERLDQQAFQRLIAQENLPYTLTLAETIDQALQHLHTNPVDVVVTDYHLSNGNAMALLQAIETIPIIVITGAGDDQIAVDVLKHGAYDYISKDIDGHYLRVLPQVILNTLQRKKANDELQAYQNRLEHMVQERAQELYQERELLAVTLAGLNDGVIAVDTQGRVTVFNTAAQKLTGYTHAEIYGRYIQDLLCISNEKVPEQSCATPLCQVLTTGKRQTGSHWDILVGKHKQQQPVSMVATPIQGENGTLIGAVMVLRDESRAREMDHLKEEFLATISHELRTPLSIVMGATKLLLDNAIGDLNNEQRDVLETSRNNINRLGKIVDSLLDISKLEAAQMNVQPQATPINNVIQEVVATFQEQAQQKIITLVCELPQEMCLLDIDANKISKALGHLINNSLRFTPAQGSICVRGSQQKDRFVIDVQDTGIGISERDIPKLFQTFVQIGRKPGPGEQGTGLGLAIAKGIVEKHNGQIWINSQEGQGTTVSFSLPLAPQTEIIYQI